MRKVLGMMTSNRFKGIFTGFLITGLIQSSSATTVMVVSFVNAGLLSLIQSIGVIMGANIGTTITAWLISIIGFKVSISTFALPLFGVGLPLLFARGSKLKSWGEVIIGFAILFIGLNELKGSVPDLGSNPEILQFLSGFTNMGILSVLLFIGIGTLVTISVQSSSAAMALTLVMANNGWIPFEMAAAMVLGENIGTTITANLAALIANVHAKRAARAHLIFNISGVVWMVILFRPFLSMINHYMIEFQGVSPMDPGQPESIPIALSIFHTSFNIINTLVLVWFVKPIANIVTKLVKSTGEDDDYHLRFIGVSIIRTPDISILEARKEISQLGTITAKMSGFLQTLVVKKKEKKRAKFMDRIKKYEEITDTLEVEIANYLAKVAEGNISASSSVKIRSLLSINNDLERIGDVFYQMSLSIQRKNESNLWFTEEQTESLMGQFKLVDEALEIMNKNLESDYSKVTLTEARNKEKEINANRSKLRREHLKKIEKSEYDVLSGMVYIDLVAALEKVGDHTINVAGAIKGKI